VNMDRQQNSARYLWRYFCQPGTDCVFAAGRQELEMVVAMGKTSCQY
jgi:hypothetical protein